MFSKFSLLPFLYQTLAKLEKFMTSSSLKSTTGLESKAIAEAVNEDDTYGWRKGELKFFVDPSAKVYTCKISRLDLPLLLQRC